MGPALVIGCRLALQRHQVIDATRVGPVVLWRHAVRACYVGGMNIRIVSRNDAKLQQDEPVPENALLFNAVDIAAILVLLSDW